MNINKHITETFVSLRVGMALIAFSLPILLILVSKYSEAVCFKESISAFYYTPMRNLFVGSLCAVGSFLYLYKGFNENENRALNFAGIFAVCVAFLPTKPPGVDCRPSSENMDAAFSKVCITAWMHGISAVLFFLFVAYVCVYCGKYTVELIENKKVGRRYIVLYKVIGALMVLLPLISVFYIFLVGEGDYWLFVLEFAAIVVFSVFWLAKAMELNYHDIRLEEQIIKGDKNIK